MKDMRESFVDRFCGALGETERTHPFGINTAIWTVRGRMFAAYTVRGAGVSVRVKDRTIAHKLVGEGRVSKVQYLKNGVWVMLPWKTSPDELRRFIDTSYQLVLSDSEERD